MFSRKDMSMNLLIFLIGANVALASLGESTINDIKSNKNSQHTNNYVRLKILFYRLLLKISRYKNNDAKISISPRLIR